jgi:hypothetical protein
MRMNLPMPMPKNDEQHDQAPAQDQSVECLALREIIERLIELREIVEQMEREQRLREQGGYPETD